MNYTNLEALQDELYDNLIDAIKEDIKNGYGVYVDDLIEEKARELADDSLIYNSDIWNYLEEYIDEVFDTANELGYEIKGWRDLSEVACIDLYYKLLRSIDEYEIEEKAEELKNKNKKIFRDFIIDLSDELEKKGVYTYCLINSDSTAFDEINEESTVGDFIDFKAIQNYNSDLIKNAVDFGHIQYSFLDQTVADVLKYYNTCGQNSKIRELAYKIKEEILEQINDYFKELKERAEA